MDGLVHERAAAVELPGSAPAAGVVVLLGSPPFDVGVAQGQAAESPQLDRLFEPEIGRREPRWENRAQPNARGVTGVDDGVATRQCDLQRFFNDDVLAGPGGLDCRLHVGAAGRADADDIKVRDGEQCVQVVECRTAAFGQPGDLVGVGGIAAPGPDDPGALDLVDRPGVKLGDHAAADDAETVLCHRSFCSLDACLLPHSHSHDLALADADDQAVGDVNEGLGVGDGLAVGPDIETPLLDHAASIRCARFQVRAL